MHCNATLQNSFVSLPHTNKIEQNYITVNSRLCSGSNKVIVFTMRNTENVSLRMQGLVHMPKRLLTAQTFISKTFGTSNVRLMFKVKLAF